MQQTKHWKRGFFTIMSGQAVSFIGSSAVQFSLIWWLSSETGSPFIMSMAGLAAFIPQLVLGPIVGVWIDRLHRKTVIICADMFIGLAALGMSLFFLLGSPPHEAVFAVLFLRALGGVFHGPAIQAAVPMLVPQDQLVKANGWSQFLQSGAFMLGPVLGAAMYSVLPLWVILLSDLVGAAVASATVAAVKIPDPPRQNLGKPHLLREIKEGADALRQDKRLWVVTLASILAMVFYMPLATYYPLMSSDHFKATAWHAGLVELLYASGMMVCAVVFSRFGNLKHKMAIIHWGVFGLGISTLVSGILPPEMGWFWAFTVACTIMGASTNVYNIPFVAYMQERIPPEKMGRVFSLIGSASSAAMPLGLLLAVPVSEKNGVDLWFMISGIAILLTAAVSATLVSRMGHKGKTGAKKQH